MDVTLGPWTADVSIDAGQRKPLADAMGDEAWTTASKAPGFTPKKAEDGKAAKSGFTISGKLTSVTKQGRDTHVKAMFTVLTDGTFSNIQPVPGDATASGSSGAEDAVRGMTEARINKLLNLIKSGAVRKVS